MRELERDLPATHASAAPTQVARVAMLGAGRAGGALARAARAGGLEATVVGRDGDLAAALGEDPGGASVLLCVPDSEIAAACRRAVEAGPALVGHVSGVTTLAALLEAAEAGIGVFSLHPLQTIPSPDADLAGAPCAIAGGDAGALEAARRLALACGMEPFVVPDEARAAYHAAASMASNYLVTLQESASALLEAAGVDAARDVLAPLVLRSAANWAESGADALTGPIARGDEQTVALHLDALREHAPGLVPAYEALAERTRHVARRKEES